MSPRVWILGAFIVGLLAVNLVVVASRGPAQAVRDDSPGTVAKGIDPSDPPREDGREARDARDAVRRTEAPTEPSGAGVAAPELPAPPPAAGTYRYRSTTISESSFQASSREETGVDRYRFEQPRPKGKAMRQLVVVKRSDGDRVERLNEWRADGLYRVRSTGERGSGTCTHDPPLLLMPLPATPGQTFDPGEEVCTESGAAFGGPGVETTSEYRVAHTEDVVVGDQTVPTVVIEAMYHSTFDGTQGSGESDMTITRWFSPEHRLFVKVSVVIDGEFSGTPPAPSGTFHSESISELLSLDPV